jgi:hypothetical protein
MLNNCIKMHGTKTYSELKGVNGYMLLDTLISISKECTKIRVERLMSFMQILSICHYNFFGALVFVNDVGER